VSNGRCPHGSGGDHRVLAAWPDYLETALEDALRLAASATKYDETAPNQKDRAPRCCDFDKLAWRELTGKLSSKGVARTDLPPSLCITGSSRTRFCLRQPFDKATEATNKMLPLEAITRREYPCPIADPNEYPFGRYPDAPCSVSGVAS
jgi:hypothetical protein